MVDTGRHPHMGFEPQQPRSTLELANEFAECIALGIEEAKAALTKAKDGKEEYEVEAILDSRMRYNQLEYLLKFKGYDESHNQWEVHTHVHGKPKIVQFHRKYPGAARHINVAIFDSIPFTRVDLATSWRSSRVVRLRFEGGVM
jgi:hypothetical protein